MENTLCYNCFQEVAPGIKFCTYCGHPMAQDRDKYPHALPYGTILAGKYITGRVLGQGGFGITYKAQEYKTKQMVAIKEFFPDTMATRGATNSAVPYSGQRGEDFTYGKTTFLEEARTLAQFIDVPGIVQVYSYFEENGTAYFAMEYVEGISLQKYVAEQGGRISWEEAKRILLPVADALAAVHAKGIIHRDIKPDNIYINKEGQTKVLDFGSARYSMGEKSRSLDVVLTHGFAPREQYSRHGRQGAYTDVYSLAATFYYAITGKKPPDSIDRLDEDTMPLPSSLGAQIPAAQEDVLMKALAVEPQDRYASMTAFKQALVGEESSAPALELVGAAVGAPVPGSTRNSTATLGGASYTDVMAGMQDGQPSQTPYKPQPVQTQPGNTGVDRTMAVDRSVPETPGASGTQPKQSGLGASIMDKVKGLPKWAIPAVAGVVVLAVIVGAVAGRGSKKADTADSSVTVAVESEAPSETPTPEPSPSPTSSQGGSVLGGIIQTPAPAPSAALGYYPVSGMIVGDSTFGPSALADQDINGSNTYVILRTENTGVVALFDGEQMDFELSDQNMVVNGEAVPYTLEDDKITISVEEDGDAVTLEFTKSDESGPPTGGTYSITTDEYSGSCGDNVTWNFDKDEATLYIDGTGPMFDYEYMEDIPWYSFNIDIDFVRIGEGVTRIGEGAFFECGMVSVTIPTTVETIGNYAFASCPYLFDITIPANVREIGEQTFFDCPRLGWIEFDGTINIGMEAFGQCPELERVTFFGGITGMGENAFLSDTTLVQYPGDESSWEGVRDQNYGGTLTWEAQGDVAAPQDDSFSGYLMESEGGKYSVTFMKEEWGDALYTMDGDSMNFYHEESDNAGVGGFLFGINLYQQSSDYDFLPSYEVVGTLTKDSESYDVVIIYPTDVQFTPETQAGYQELRDDIDNVKRTVAGINGYTFAFG